MTRKTTVTGMNPVMKKAIMIAMNEKSKILRLLILFRNALYSSGMDSEEILEVIVSMF